MAQQAIERRMTGRCVITVVGDGSDGVQWDPITLEVSDHDPLEIYDGPLMIGAMRTGQQRDRGYGDFRETVTEILIPLEAWADGVVPLDAKVEILEGPGQGREWRITGILHHTNSLTRRFEVTRLDPEVVSS